MAITCGPDDIARLVREKGWPDPNSAEYLAFERACIRSGSGGPIDSRSSESGGGAADDLVVFYFREHLTRIGRVDTI